MSACPGDDTGGQETTTDTTSTTDNTTGTTEATPPDPTTSTTDPTPDPDTSTTDDTDTDESADSETTEAPGGTCELYCTNAIANCTGENEIYAGMDECMATCAGMPEGDPEDQEGNSAYCRAYHAGDPASADPATHCPHASASGGGVCGSVCEGYCNQVLNNCTGAEEAFPTDAECMAACEAFPDDGPFNAVMGNSAQCRTYHASFPAAADAATHCPHASSNGGEVCGELCEGYCSQVMANCGMLYGDMMECMDECSMFPTNGDWNAIDGDSVQCRTYHASFPAAADAMVHCPHAAPDGGGVCV